MAILKVLKAPDPQLKIVAKPVNEITDTIRTLIKDMFETMYAEEGMGLAATQVNVHKRVVVMDLNAGCDDHEPTPKCYINPEIFWSSEEHSIVNEGCLSVPENRAPVDRPARVKIRYLDESGVKHEEEADGMLATCIQHEIDHLNGILFIDHLSKLKHDIIMRKLIRLKNVHAL